MALTFDQILVRARKADGIKCAYIMGGGTNKASTPTPFAPSVEDGGIHIERASDCSNFMCWACGVDKHDGSVWWNTDAVVADAKGAQKRWIQLQEPVAGCGVVYAGHSVDGQHQAGHCGIVTDPSQCKTLDCGSSSYKRGGDAVTERTIAGFWHRDPMLPQPIFVAPKP